MIIRFLFFFNFIMNYLYLEKKIQNKFEKVNKKLPNIKKSNEDRKYVYKKFDSILKILDDKIFIIFEEFSQSTLV